jgi:hypothetical protein
MADNGAAERFRTCGRNQGLSAKVRQLSAFEAKVEFLRLSHHSRFITTSLWIVKKGPADNNRETP